MIFFLAILSLFAIPSSLELLAFCKDLSAPLHDFCLSRWSDTAHSQSTSALLCGADLTDLTERQRLVQAGLYHLVVVSGTHLTFLNQVLHRVLPRRFTFFGPVCLGVFCLMSSWQPPVVRAWMQSLSRAAGRSPQVSLLDSWLLCLALHPQWIHSLSLHLSVAASLALVAKCPSPLKLTLRIVTFLSPLLAGWSILHPTVALLAVFLAPISLALWISTSYLEIINPDGFYFWNQLLIFWNQILDAVGSFNPPIQKLALQTGSWAWLYVLALFLWVHAWQILEARKKEKARA